MVKVVYEITFPNGSIVNEVSYQKTQEMIAKKGGHFKAVYVPIIKKFPKKNYKAGWFRQ